MKTKSTLKRVISICLSFMFILGIGIITTNTTIDASNEDKFLEEVVILSQEQILNEIQNKFNVDIEFTPSPTRRVAQTQEDLERFRERTEYFAAMIAEGNEIARRTWEENSDIPFDKIEWIPIDQNLFNAD